LGERLKKARLVGGPFALSYNGGSKWPVNGIPFFIFGIFFLFSKAIAAATTVTILLVGQRSTPMIAFHKLHLLKL
jgi:hypothetical protein